MKTIGETAELAGVSTDALRHYDKIGLLKPLARSDSGYRLYGHDELLRLREILIWRRLGFPLADIAALIDEPGHDRVHALARQLELAEAQLDKFQGLTRGLKAAMATLDAGRSVPDDEVFVGFARLADDEEDELPGASARAKRGPRRIATFSLLSGRSRLGTADGFGDDIPRRIVATDPIRLAESLVALGVLPVGTGTYEDRFTGQLDPGEWTWPPAVERAVRDRISDVGFYGSDVRRIERLAPDLIFDLTAFWDGGSCMTEAYSQGRYGYRDLSSLAPTKLLPYLQPAGGPVPAFPRLLRGVASVLGREARAERLMTLWNARTRVLRAHLSGHEVAVVASWGPGSVWGDGFYAPTDVHCSQAFSSVGLHISVPRNAQTSYYEAMTFDLEQIGELEADTLFLHTRHLDRGKVEELRRSKSFSKLRAARLGRVFELGWEFVNSGWFGANWQLMMIGHAFGLTQLRAEGDEDLALAVADPASGTIELTTVSGACSVTLHGPATAPIRIELSDTRSTHIEVSREVASRLAALPELYSLEVAGRSVPVRFRHDRESALARLAARDPVPDERTSRRSCHRADQPREPLSNASSERF